jgi:hypothetical protein
MRVAEDFEIDVVLCESLTVLPETKFSSQTTICCMAAPRGFRGSLNGFRTEMTELSAALQNWCAAGPLVRSLPGTRIMPA